MHFNYQVMVGRQPLKFTGNLLLLVHLILGRLKKFPYFCSQRPENALYISSVTTSLLKVMQTWNKKRVIYVNTVRISSPRVQL